jgi:ATP-dependent Lhr-like helicase
LGWTELRPVQELASQAILDGHNAIVLAPTAGGKTEASMFPVLAQLLENPPKSVGALYIAPIKALLNNQAERLGTYTQMVGLSRFLWHGDVMPSQKKRFIKEPDALLMTTPESLEVTLLSSKVPSSKLFCDLRMVVIDEVHALAGQDRGAHLMSVLQRISRLTPHDLQRIGLSATVGNPEAILEWLQGPSRRPRSIIDPPKAPSPRDLRVTLTQTTRDLSQTAAQTAAGQKSLFFCQSRALSEEVAQHMRGRGTDVFVHHSSVSLEERQAAEARFHHGRDAVIVCTSTLELGIDVGDLDRVLQADAPSTVSSFLQRMGRTGRRAGQRANTMFLCSDTVTALQAAALVELARQKWVESVPVLTRCWPVLVHQLLALVLQFGAISSERCWTDLRQVPDFRDITQSEFEQLVDHMLHSEFLYETGGLLSVGDATERVFGRRNFQEIYAVFTTPQLYNVFTGDGRAIGSLEQAFVDKLVDGISCFLLGGRPWVVESVRHTERSVLAHPAPAGRKPLWGGYLPQFLGFHLCREMAAILVDSRPLPYLDANAQSAVEELRRDFGRALAGHSWSVQSDPGGDVLLTFAGGAVNQTIKYGLHLLRGWSSTSDNFRVRLSDSVSNPELRQALAELGQPAFWQSPDVRDRLLASLPEYRLSKFQQALPLRFAMEMIRDYLIDIDTTCHFLSNG